MIDLETDAHYLAVVELAHQWIVKSDTRTTIEELSAP